MPILETAEQIDKLKEIIKGIQGNEGKSLIITYLIISIVTIFINYFIQFLLNKK